MIVGAGLAGLIAAHIFPDRPIFEAAPEPTQAHKALLRFRTDEIGKLTGIPFRAVNVRKAIWEDGREIPPSIRVANMYSAKCLHRLVPDRSIWNLEPVTRYIAPDDFYVRLVEQHSERISWSCPVDLATIKEPTISTAPLDLTCEQLGIEHSLTFERAGIWVVRMKVPRCDVFQTIYFPDLDAPLYRASITGDTLICEFMRNPASEVWINIVCRAFSLSPFDVQLSEVETVEQRYGKIAPVPNEERRLLLGLLTEKYNIFSFGRFATWRNLLLDDLIEDAAIIKRLIAANEYERKLIHAKRSNEDG